MSWNTGVKRNVHLKLTSNLGIYDMNQRLRKHLPENIRLVIVEMLHLPGTQRFDLKDKTSGLKRTIRFARKVCVHFKTETNKLKIVA